MKTKQILIIGAVLLALFGIIALGARAKANRPVPPTPTAQPTPKPPAQSVTCGGGDIFIPAAHDYLLQTYNIDVQSKKVDTFGFADYVTEHPGELDCIWPGSVSAYQLFLNDPRTKGMVLDSTVPFRTFAMVVTRADLYLPTYLKYGLVTKQDDGAYIFHMGILINATKENTPDHQVTWAGLFQRQAALMGITFDEDLQARKNKWMNEPALLGITDPTASSGGMATFLMTMNYAIGDGSTIIQENDLPTLLPIAIQNFRDHGAMEKRSPDLLPSYIQKPTPGIISSESLYISWYMSLSADRQQTDGQLIVGMYPDYTVATDHTLAALTDKGRILVNAFKNDPNLAQFGWSKGMRTLAGGIAQKPGSVNLSTIEADPVFVNEPSFPVFDAVKKALLPYVK